MNINLFHGDCLEVMKKIEDKSIDMIFTDLPYGTTHNQWDIKIPLNDYAIISNKVYYKDEYLLYAFKNQISYSDAEKWFDDNKQQGLWTHFDRIIKDNGVIALWAQSSFDIELINNSSVKFRYRWVIKKTRATGHLNAKKMPLKGHEYILIFYKNLPKYHPQKTTGHPPVHSYTKHVTDGSCYGKTKTGISGGGNTDRYPVDVLEFKWDTQISKLHSTQKPLEACRYMIKTYTDEGDAVLDCCMGSNTTGVACRELKRNYIGIEADDEIYKKACERLAYSHG